MGRRNELCLLSFLATVAGVLGGEYCYDFDEGYRRWCSYGCCGALDGDCCDANVALIVGLTVLGVLVVSTIIAVVCCCVRRRASHGTVIQSNPATGMVVTSGQTTVMTTGQPMAYQPGAYVAQPYPMGPQAPPAPYGAPATAAPPPSYAQAQAAGGYGGQVNAGYDQKY